MRVLLKVLVSMMSAPASRYWAGVCVTASSRVSAGQSRCRRAIVPVREETPAAKVDFSEAAALDRWCPWRVARQERSFQRGHKLLDAVITGHACLSFSASNSSLAVGLRLLTRPARSPYGAEGARHSEMGRALFPRGHLAAVHHKPHLGQPVPGKRLRPEACVHVAVAP